MRKRTCTGLLSEMVKRGEKYKDLSKLLGIPESSICRRFYNEIPWKETEKQKICEYYNCKSKDLFN